ncbi:MAG TPA: glycine oxidase ThiO [Blastocatellia bacterium]|nr:glycine oxidase ThiO [Blastocatellia bacterium]
MTYDVIVVGGGIIGCSIAFKLSSQKLSVLLIERGTIGCEASRAAAGMLSPQAEAPSAGPFFDLCLRSRNLYPGFASSVSEASGLDVQYRDEGTLCVVIDDADEHEQRDWARWQFEAGLPIEAVEREALAGLEPALTRSARSAVFIPEDHQIENRLLMDGLSLAVKRSGVATTEGVEVESLVCEKDRVTGVNAGGARYSAHTVVVAAGSWSSRLLEPNGVNVSVVPARGQMIALKPARALLAHVVYSRGCYLVPRRDNRIVIGSTVEYAGYEKATTAATLMSLLSAAIRVVPALSDSVVAECWSGLRPDTSDHLPVLGSCSMENLILATGHFRSGILLAPVTAEMISDVILTGETPAAIKPFAADRFKQGHS